MTYLLIVPQTPKVLIGISGSSPEMKPEQAVDDLTRENHV